MLNLHVKVTILFDQSPIIMPSALTISNLAVGYRRHRVAQGLTRDIAAGTLTLVTGRNGAGKSTILRTLAGLQPPLGGQIYWFGQDWTACEAHHRARTVAVVLTDRVEGVMLTARDVVRTGRLPYTRLSGKLSNEDEKICETALERLGAAHLAARKLDTLSDGERQRVMIARALAQSTPAIILDEPTAFLDHEGKAATFSLLRELSHHDNKTILVASHDIEVATPQVDAVWTIG